MALSVMLDVIILEPDHRNSTLVKICKQIKADASHYPSTLSPAAYAEKHILNIGCSETADPKNILLELLEECLTNDVLPGQAPNAVHVNNEPFHVVNLDAVPHAWESAVSTSPLLGISTAANECDYFTLYIRGFKGETEAMPTVNNCFTHTFTLHVVSICILIGLFMIPLGTAVASEVSSIPFSLLSALVGVLLALVWI